MNPIMVVGQRTMMKKGGGNIVSAVYEELLSALPTLFKNYSPT